MSRRDLTRLPTTVLALAFLLHAAVRPLAMSAGLLSVTAAHHEMAGMPHDMAAPAGSHSGHAPAEHRHCSDECCGISVSVFTMPVAAASFTVAAPVTVAAVAMFTQSAPLRVPRYRQPLPIGPPASRA